MSINDLSTGVFLIIFWQVIDVAIHIKHVQHATEEWSMSLETIIYTKSINLSFPIDIGDDFPQLCYEKSFQIPLYIISFIFSLNIIFAVIHIDAIINVFCR